MKRVVVIGGGLSGLISAITLVRQGIGCTLFERHDYPLHRVCGEYVSNETTGFLKRENLYPEEFNPPLIKRFQLSTRSGDNRIVNLDLGGFGISRYTFDHFLFQIARKEGVDVQSGMEVTGVSRNEAGFILTEGTQTKFADVVIGAHGKRSRLDISMARPFTRKRSPFVGVKYHILTDHPTDLISLHTFPGGYCGISQVESNTYNLCYLVQRDCLRRAGSIPQLEMDFLCRNPLLKTIFESAQFLFKKPETINEISFATKAPVEGGVLMVGDAAGMIAPLCGNGMAMAIHGGWMASQWAGKFIKGALSRQEMEKGYAAEWHATFARRLWLGRRLQRAFESPWLAASLVNMVMQSAALTRMVIKRSHGKEF